jgi:hypothetical protein
MMDAPVEGPLAGFTGGYRRCLDQRGYSPRAVGERVELLGGFSGWLGAQGLSSADAIPSRAQQFLDTRRAAGQKRVPTLRMLVELFEYLRDEQVLPVERVGRTGLEDLLDRYGRYLEHDRGLGRIGK